MKKIIIVIITILVSYLVSEFGSEILDTINMGINPIVVVSLLVSIFSSSILNTCFGNIEVEEVQIHTNEFKETTPVVSWLGTILVYMGCIVTNMILFMM